MKLDFGIRFFFICKQLIATLTSLVKNLEKTNQTKDFQIILQKKNNILQQQQLTALKLQKSNSETLKWILTLIGFFSAGYLIGNL